MVCEPDDIWKPKRFVLIEGNPKIKRVACGELHTLVVTNNGDMYVWGDNKMGQLGLGAGSKLEVGAPDQARMEPGPIELLATGTGHTVAQFLNGETYAWGCQSCGRLGLQDKTQDKLVWEPCKVAATWSSIESMRVATPQKAQAAEENTAKAEEDQAQEAAQSTHMAQILSKTKVTAFHTMQSLLHSEDVRHHEDQLAELEDKLEAELETILKNMRKSMREEDELARLEGELEQSLRSNLRWFKLNPFDGGESKLDSRLVARLPIYEELMWVLQNQTCYLATLSTCIKGDECNVFYSVVERLYATPSDRIRRLFLMMLRLMIDRETEAPGQRLESLFNNMDESRVLHVFSTYALSEKHYRDVVHAYLAIDKMDDESATVLKLVKGTSDRSDTFALNFADFKDSLGDEEKKNAGDEQALKALFAQSMDAFRDFLIEDFCEAITAVKLPTDIRQLLHYCGTALNNRQFPMGPSDGTIPLELRKVEPLLSLVFQGIWKPMFKNPAKFASKECFLRKSAEVVKSDSLLVSNLGVISDFLEQMIAGTLNPKEKILRSAAQNVKPKLLKYLKAEGDVVDDLETKIMMDTYLSHFDRSKQPVTVATSDLLKLSNLLKEHMNKLRIKESDPVEHLCKDIPTWPAESIMAAEKIEGGDVLHNFAYDHRFLFNESEVGICHFSRCLLPRRLCRAATTQLIKRYECGEDSENPRKVLEMLFQQVEPLSSSTFSQLQEEFEKLRAKYRAKSPPDFEKMQLIQKGVAVVEELLNVEAHPQDVLLVMSDWLMQRNRHFQYLQQIEGGLVSLKKEQDNYTLKLGKWKIQLEDALGFSLDLKLPKTFEKQRDYPSFKFVQVARHMEKKRDFDPKKMQQLGCQFAPIATYTVKQLKKMNVLVELHPPFASLAKNLQVTIRAPTSGGVEMAMNVVHGTNKNNMKTVNLTEEKLQEMTKAEKNEATVITGPTAGEAPIMTCNSSNFVRLITKLKEATA